MIDVAVPFAGRVERLHNLLASVDGRELVDAVYIGHNAPDDLPLPEMETPVHVLDCGTNYSPGRARRETWEASTAPYLLVVDSDMELPATIEPLLHILEHEESLGGVGGGLIEPSHNRIRQTGKRFEVHRNQLNKDAKGAGRELERAGGEPFIRFHQLANCTLYKRECLAEYAWDPKYLKRAHLDFYLGHYFETEWDFAASPNVWFWHHPGGTDQYEELRYEEARHQQGMDRIFEKWPVDSVEVLHRNWMEAYL